MLGKWITEVGEWTDQHLQLVRSGLLMSTGAVLLFLSSRSSGWYRETHVSHIRWHKRGYRYGYLKIHPLNDQGSGIVERRVEWFYVPWIRRIPPLSMSVPKMRECARLRGMPVMIPGLSAPSDHIGGIALNDSKLLDILKRWHNRVYSVPDQSIRDNSKVWLMRVRVKPMNVVNDRLLVDVDLPWTERVLRKRPEWYPSFMRRCWTRTKINDAKWSLSSHLKHYIIIN